MNAFVFINLLIKKDPATALYTQEFNYHLKNKVKFSAYKNKPHIPQK